MGMWENVQDCSQCIMGISCNILPIQHLILLLLKRETF